MPFAVVVETCAPVLLTAAAACRGKTNFFEKRVGDYQKAGVMNSLNGDSHAIEFDADF